MIKFIKFVVFLLILVLLVNTQQTGLDLGPAQNQQSLQQKAAQKSYESEQKQQQNIRNYQSDGTESVTDAKSAQQKTQFSQIAKTVQKGTIYQDYMFSVEGGEEFILNLTKDQQIVFYMFLYAETEGTYARIGDVSQEPPVRVHIYQNNRHLIVNQAFFFLKYIIFQGKKDSIYSIRFYSSGKRKFVVMNMKILTQQSDINYSISNDKAFRYSQQTNNIKKEMLGITGAFNRYYTLSAHYLKRVQQQTQKYYFSLIAQIMVGFIVSIIQIRMVMKLLRGNSII